MPTPIDTPRLHLRAFALADAPALHALLADPGVNRFLPLLPPASLAETEQILRERFLRPGSCAICLREQAAPIGYVTVAPDGSHDLGYAVARAHWGSGYATEAAGAVLHAARAQGLPFLTATHDVQNPASGRVMRHIGMAYRYTYLEQWQPKDIRVAFRLYQINFTGDPHATYQKYWNMYPEHYVEAGL